MQFVVEVVPIGALGTYAGLLVELAAVVVGEAHSTDERVPVEA